MKRAFRRSAAAGCALAALLLPVPPAGAQVPDDFTNLEVLDKDIGKQELVGIMRGFATGLGVRCNHCHVGPDNLQGMDFATDEKEHKRAARVMLEMTRTINGQYLGSWEEDGEDHDGEDEQVSCFTCHRGQAEPPAKLASILADTAMSEGVDDAMTQYQELKKEYYGAGLYDFREGIFGELAQSAFDAGKTDAAMQILGSAIEIYPDSADLHAFLGMALMQGGDAAGAAAEFDEALALDPDNASAKRGKTMLDRMRQQGDG